MWRPNSDRSDCSDCNADRTNRQTALRTSSKCGWSAMPMAGAGRDLTTTVVTAPTGIILATAIGVIITTTATTTINDDNGSGAYELRYPSTDK